METIYNFFQEHTVIAILGIFSLLGTVITLTTGLAQTLRVLAGKQLIPNWVTLIFFLLWILTYFSKGGQHEEVSAGNLQKIVGVNYGVQSIELDGKSFYRCSFIDSQILISGYGETSLVECSFTPTCKYTFTGPARRTLLTISALYSQPDFRPIIDKFFDDLKKGTIPQHIVPEEYKKN